MDDVRAVMDAAGSKRAALFGISEGAPMSLLFAATYPERARAFAWMPVDHKAGRRAPEKNRLCRAWTMPVGVDVGFALDQDVIGLVT